MNQTNVPSAWSGLQKWAWQRRNGLLILCVIGFLIFAQWPMLKGMFYRAIGAPMPADKIAWRASYQAALEESQRTGKPVLLDFSASWCPPCQLMKREVWPDAQVGELIAASYIPVLLDVDDPASGDAASRYEVDTIPRIILVDAKGTVLKNAGYLSRGAMVKFLKENARSEREPS